MIADITFQGPLITEHSLPGERRADGVFPAHPSGMPLSQDRWLLLCSPRGLRCHDDDHSIIYQLREGRPDGRLLREGFLAQGTDSWDVTGDGTPYVKLLRHPMGFGVPKGALIDGRPAINANVFAVQWCVGVGGVMDHAAGTYRADHAMQTRYHQVRWCQFRLNDAHDDIEILQPDQQLRQKGYEQGPAFCAYPDTKAMIQSLVPAVPGNRDCTHWLIANNLQPSIAVLRFEFNTTTRLYEWVQTGPMIPEDPRYAFTEGCLARWEGGYVLGIRARRLNAAPPDWAGGTARDRGDTAWVRLADPMTQVVPATVVQDPNRQAPMTVHTCADGVLRMFSGDFTHSPYQQRRDPLYCWDVQPDTWQATGRRVVIDTVKEGIFPNDATPRSTCFASVLPHMGGDTQYVLFRGMCFRYRAGVEANAPAITPDQFAKHATYYATIRYTQQYPPAWTFAAEGQS